MVYNIIVNFVNECISRDINDPINGLGVVVNVRRERAPCEKHHQYCRYIIIIDAREKHRVYGKTLRSIITSEIIFTNIILCENCTRVQRSRYKFVTRQYNTHGRRGFSSRASWISSSLIY